MKSECQRLWAALRVWCAAVALELSPYTRPLYPDNDRRGGGGVDSAGDLLCSGEGLH